MLTKEQIAKIRKNLKSAKNPLFFFDDDPDGICSYLLLKKFIKKGRPVIVKAKPTLDLSLIRKVEERNPDHIFVLDLADISQEFIDQANTKITWIDHHPLQNRKNVDYFNTKQNNPKSTMSVAEQCYEVTQENMWIAAIGAISDWVPPKFLEEFKKKYPEIIKIKSNEPGELIYRTPIEKITKLMLFLTKNPTTDVYRMLSILEKVESPQEILDQTTPRARYIFKKIKPIQKAYESFFENAKKTKIEDGVLIFHYPSSRWSFTTELANELQFKTEAEVVIIAREKDNKVKMSIRSRKTPILQTLKKSIEGLQASGGGHELASGAVIDKDQFQEFLTKFKENLNHK